MTQSVPIESITYRYPWYLRGFTLLLNFLGFAYPLYLIGMVVFAGNFGGEPWSLQTFFYLLLLVVVSWAVFILTANYFPEVTVDKSGLYVSFLWRRLHVSWQDIVEIKPPVFNLPKRPTTWVVKTRALTPFHRLYGLLYAFSFHPSFIIRFEIDKHKDLIQKIRKRSFT